ncbi:hypothetical protein PROFUN_02956 [Planoprotostelium fungivorum]|uniref:Rho-GAP domain-containing protein n=1 Tax=Planoprotostelium fungivorum TaxID=1890364 RepID=A0A2P6NX55_9EUKA|nr:hypothetical protein PROFUN_02956 [Planoprotostelium fungivorum]
MSDPEDSNEEDAYSETSVHSEDDEECGADCIHKKKQYKILTMFITYQAEAEKESEDSKDKIEKQQQDIEDLKSQLDQLEEEIIEKEDVISSLETTLNNEKRENIGTLTTLMQEIEYMEKGNSQLEEEKNALVIQVEQQSREMKEKDERIRSLEAQLNEMTSAPKIVSQPSRDDEPTPLSDILNKVTRIENLLQENLMTSEQEKKNMQDMKKQLDAQRSKNTDKSVSLLQNSISAMLAKKTEEKVKGLMGRGAFRSSRDPSKDEETWRGPLFGENMEEVAERQQALIPKIILETVAWMRQKEGYRQIGVFVLPALSKQLKGLRDEYDEKGSVDLSVNRHLVHVIAALLKSYLKEIPGSVIPQKFHASATLIADAPHQQQSAKIRDLVQSLPQVHRDTFLIVSQLLSQVAANHSVNNMDAAHTSKVFTPILFGNDSKKLQKVLERVLNDFKPFEDLLSGDVRGAIAIEEEKVPPPAPF